MSEEEKKTPLDAPLPGSAPTAPKPRKRSAVVTYLAVLFAAAFLLLLLAYFMQQRTSEAAIGSLKESITSIESLDALIAENRTLREENGTLTAHAEELEQALADAHSQLDVLPDIISHQEYTLEQTCQALDYFWQLNEAYVLGRSSLCRELIGTMEDATGGRTPLKDYLPAESAAGTDRPSPAQRYEDICGALN